MPVRLAVKGREIKGSWGMDVMVAPERQRRGLGEVLFRTWDRNVGASLGLGLSDASYRLFQKLKWPDVGPVPCLVKPLSRRAFRHPRWPVAINRLISALTWPVRQGFERRFSSERMSFFKTRPKRRASCTHYSNALLEAKRSR